MPPRRSEEYELRPYKPVSKEVIKPRKQETSHSMLEANLQKSKIQAVKISQAFAPKVKMCYGLKTKKDRMNRPDFGTTKVFEAFVIQLVS